MNDISFLKLFLDASLVVKLVMMVLIFASVLSWALILQKVIAFRHAKLKLDEFESAFWSGIDLNKFYTKLRPAEQSAQGIEAIFLSGFKEYTRIKRLLGQDAQHLLDNVQRALRVAITKQESKLEGNMSLLATIQSICPYIGLFGTVWGIMHALGGLGQVQQATLAMVAPGISEALVATAMGLIAAIPAGVAYNRFISYADHISRRYRSFGEELTGILTTQAQVANQTKEEPA